MGVKGLLPSLQSITRQVELEKYRGLSAAVDAMCWLHKGIFTGNVGALAKYQFMERRQQQSYQENENEIQHKNTQLKDKSDINDSILASTVKRIDFDRFSPKKTNQIQQYGYIDNIDAVEAMSKCIDYVIRHSIQLQKDYGLDIILVIDGDSLPSKQCIDEKRRAEREEAFKQGLKAEKRGDNRQARKFFSRACSISYEMRYELITQCKRYHIPFIVAPYEADAQMAKLALSNEVDVVITEDSDLLAYGCPRVLFKLDFKIGKGEEIQLMKDLASNEPLSFRHWTHDMFVYMCILAGCDYCAGVPGIGLQSAHKLVRIYRKPKKIFSTLKRDGKLENGFEDAFIQAYRTFRHQRVFCSQNRQVVTLFELKEIDNGDVCWNFLGRDIEPSVAIGIAEGLLHPKEKKPWDEVERYKLQPVMGSHLFHSVEGRTLERKRLPIERSPIGKEKNTSNKYDMSSPGEKSLFAFFRPKKRNANGNKESNRPPLQEVHVNHVLPFRVDDGIGRLGHHQPIPSNYHEYSSKLVANNFEPISRNINSRSAPRRQGVSKALRNLKQKLSSKESRIKTKDVIPSQVPAPSDIRVKSVINHVDDGNITNQGQCGGIFKKNSFQYDHSLPPDYEQNSSRHLDNYEGSSVYLDYDDGFTNDRLVGKELGFDQYNNYIHSNNSSSTNAYKYHEYESLMSTNQLISGEKDADQFHYQTSMNYVDNLEERYGLYQNYDEGHFYRDNNNNLNNDDTGRNRSLHCFDTDDNNGLLDEIDHFLRL